MAVIPVLRKNRQRAQRALSAPTALSGPTAPITPVPPGIGPRPRDELAAWSTAPSIEDAELGDIPGFDVPSTAGRTHTIGGLDVFVREYRGPAGQPATWYIHGLDGLSTNWDRLGAALAPYSSGYAVDLPGSGFSGPPRHGRYSILTEADDVARLIKRSGRGSVHLVGNSRGGIVATYLASRHPNLIRTLTLISPAVPDLRIIGERGADAPLALVMLPGATRFLSSRLSQFPPELRAKAMAAMCFGEPEALSDADLAAAAREYTRRRSIPWVYRGTVESLRSLIRSQLRFGRWSFRAAARAVTAPVLVVWGARDRLVDVRLSRATAAAFSDADLLVLPRTGHVAQMERPREVARAMLALWQRASPASYMASPQ